MTVGSFGGYLDPEAVLRGLNVLAEQELVGKRFYLKSCGLTVVVMTAEWHPCYGEELLTLGFEQDAEPVEYPHGYREGNNGSLKPHTLNVLWKSEKLKRSKFEDLRPMMPAGVR